VWEKLWYRALGPSYNKELLPCSTQHAILSNGAMKTGWLESNLKTNQKAFKDKPKEFLAARGPCLKCMKLISNGTFCQETAKLVEEFYELSFIVRAKKVQ
jgi:hypothetical protein